MTADARPRTPAYAWYVLCVLLLAYILSFMDRMVMSLLVDPIRHDLHLSDTAIGLLIGFAFVALYSTAGLFVGRLADRSDRKWLILSGLMLWSLATAACGLAGGFVTLLMARIFVGLGESTLSPASYSLIASYFPRERLGIATSIYALGLSIGGGIGTIVIGQLSHLTAAMPDHLGIGSTGGWRATFLCIGAIGLPIALLMLTVREPRRDRADPVPRLGEALRGMTAEQRTAYVGIVGGYAIMTIASFGPVIWGPSYFIRVHGFDAARVGLLMGTVMGIGGTIGVLAGGLLLDRLTRRGIADAAPRIVIASIIAATIPLTVAYLAHDTNVAVAAFALGVVLMTVQGGLQGATIQMLAPPRMRGLAMSVYLMVANIVGMGVGSLLIALLTDRWFADPGAVGKSLAIVTVISSAVAAAVLSRTLRFFRLAVAP